jgi:pimeloyl-ACP methyl ester carboxylesterase
MPGSLLAGPGGLDLFVRHHPSSAGHAEPASHPAVLYVHGATFASGLSVGYPLADRSWADVMAADGIDVWGFDFVGYGFSARYPEQGLDPAVMAPLGRAPQAAEQVVRVLEHISEVRGGGRVSLLGHSWGSIAAGLAATQRPELVDRLVLFGPISRRTPTQSPNPANSDGWYPLTVQAQYVRFVADVPDGHPPVLTGQFDQWAKDWLATDPTSNARTPPSVRTPSGPQADILAAFDGDLAYDPALIQAPTAILRGEWDSLCTDEDARWLFNALTAAPLRRDVKLSNGTHLMHLESSRHALYRETACFLLGADT